jgi:hypothetical protein
VDLIAAAETALAQAQAQRTMAEAQLPALEEALLAAKRAMLAQVSLAEAVRVAVIPRGLLRHDDPAVREAEMAVQTAHRAFADARMAFEEAQQRLTAWQQRITEAEARLRQAQRDRFLQREYPDLWEARQRLRQDPRWTGGSRGDYHRAKWERQQLDAQIAEVLQAAGV